MQASKETILYHLHYTLQTQYVTEMVMPPVYETQIGP